MIRRPLLLLVLVLAACGGDGDGGVHVASTAPRSTVAPGSAASSLSMLGPGQAAAGATAAADDHGNDPFAATALVPGESVSGQIGTVDDDDWFAIDLSAGAHSFSLSCFGDARLVLYAPDGTTELTRSAPGTSELQHTTAQAGRHFLRVDTGSGSHMFYGLQAD